MSRHGVFELAATLDQIGPMARTVADAAALLQVIAGRDDADLTTADQPVPDYLSELGKSIRGLRIGIDPKFAFTDVDHATINAVTDTLDVFRKLGAEVADIEFPDPTQIVDDWFGVCAVQTALAHAKTYPSRRTEYGPALADLLDRGRGLTGTEYQTLLLRRAEFSGLVQRTLNDVDAIITPVLAFTTPTVERMTRMDDELISGVHRFTCPFPMSGNPTITMPAGMADGLPIGVQLVGRKFDEATLIRLGHAFQTETGWHSRHPVLH